MSKLPAILSTAAAYGVTVVGSLLGWITAAVLLDQRVVRAETALLLSWAGSAALFVAGVVAVALLWRRVPEAGPLRLAAVLLYGAATGATVAVMALIMMLGFNT